MKIHIEISYFTSVSQPCHKARVSELAGYKLHIKNFKEESLKITACCNRKKTFCPKQSEITLVTAEKHEVPWELHNSSGDIDRLRLPTDKLSAERNPCFKNDVNCICCSRFPRT